MSKESESRIYFWHPHIYGGRATIALQANGSLIEVGVAFCSPRDQFCKRFGRAIAEGRMQKERSRYHITVDVPRRENGKVNWHGAREEVYHLITLHGFGPSWVERGARRRNRIRTEMRAEIADAPA